MFCIRRLPNFKKIITERNRFLEFWKSEFAEVNIIGFPDNKFRQERNQALVGTVEKVNEFQRSEGVISCLVILKPIPSLTDQRNLRKSLLLSVRGQLCERFTEVEPGNLIIVEDLIAENLECGSNLIFDMLFGTTCTPNQMHDNSLDNQGNKNSPSTKVSVFCESTVQEEEISHIISNGNVLAAPEGNVSDISSEKIQDIQKNLKRRRNDETWKYKTAPILEQEVSEEFQSIESSPVFFSPEKKVRKFDFKKCNGDYTVSNNLFSEDKGKPLARSFLEIQNLAMDFDTRMLDDFSPPSFTEICPIKSKNNDNEPDHDQSKLGLKHSPSRTHIDRLELTCMSESGTVFKENDVENVECDTTLIVTRVSKNIRNENTVKDNISKCPKNDKNFEEKRISNECQNQLQPNDEIKAAELDNSMVRFLLQKDSFCQKLFESEPDVRLMEAKNVEIEESADFNIEIKKTNRMNSDRESKMLLPRSNSGRFNPSTTSKSSGIQPIFTKLADLKAGGYVNVYGMVRSLWVPTQTAMGEYSLRVLLKDRTLRPEIGIICLICRKNANELPPQDCLDSCLVISNVLCKFYKDTTQLIANRYSNWWVVKRNASGAFESSCCSNNSNIQLDISPMAELFHIMNPIPETCLVEANIAAINKDSNSFAVNAIVLGRFNFLPPKPTVLVVTDGTKCKYDTSKGLNLNESITCHVSFPYLDKFRESLTYISVQENERFHLPGIVPLTIARFNLLIETEGNLVRLALNHDPEPTPIVAFPKSDRKSIELKERLGISDSSPPTMDWISVSLPRMDVVNRDQIEGKIPEITEIPRFKWVFTGDLPTIKKIDVLTLLKSPFSRDPIIYKLNASLVMIWPESFSEGLTAYCNVCEVDLTSKQFSTFENGKSKCIKCENVYQAKLRFILKFYSDQTYFSVVLSQENACKFFKVDHKISELNLETCRIIDEKYRCFFHTFSGSFKKRNTEETHDIYICQKEVKNISNQKNVILYELCGLALK